MFTSLTTLFRSRPKALKASKPAPSTRLTLECLEARITPSSMYHHHDSSPSITVVVNSFNSVKVPGDHDIVLVGDIIVVGRQPKPAPPAEA